jgi:hypothetical protein
VRGEKITVAIASPVLSMASRALPFPSVHHGLREASEEPAGNAKRREMGKHGARLMS